MTKVVDGQKYQLIFRAWKIDPVTKEKLYARDYGYKAWPLWIKIS
jgi:hypothetical protein